MWCTDIVAAPTTAPQSQAPRRASARAGRSAGGSAAIRGRAVTMDRAPSSASKCHDRGRLRRLQAFGGMGDGVQPAGDRQLDGYSAVMSGSETTLVGSTARNRPVRFAPFSVSPRTGGISDPA